MFTNNFDPVAFELFSLSISWYSLAYIFGILFGWWYGKKIIIQKFKNLEKKAEIKQFDDLIAWNFDLQDKMVNKSDFIILPVTEDRESMCKGNNRPIDALQQGRMVLTNPGNPSYEDLRDFLYIGDLYEMYQDMINQPGQVVNKIIKAQEFIEQNYSPRAIAKKWEQVYENISRNNI